jgi:hypothetical protein
MLDHRSIRLVSVSCMDLAWDRSCKMSGAGGPTEKDHLLVRIASCIRAIVPKSWPRRWPWARHRWEKRISIDNTGSSDSASPPTANRAKGPRIPQVLDDGLALRRTWSCRASHSLRRGRRADLSSLFRHRLLSPSEPNQGAMGSPVVRHALLLSLLCAGALGFLLCCHGAAVAPAYVTVSAASFAPSSTCSASDPGIASQPDQLFQFLFPLCVCVFVGTWELRFR